MTNIRNVRLESWMTLKRQHVKSGVNGRRTISGFIRPHGSASVIFPKRHLSSTIIPHRRRRNHWVRIWVSTDGLNEPILPKAGLFTKRLTSDFRRRDWRT